MQSKKQIEEKLEMLEFGSLFIGDEKDAYACEKVIQILRWVLNEK